MRSVRRNDRGLSEIVGTLMLILIVVAAATLLAAFVASYQKTLQTQEAYTHDQSLESDKVFGLETSLNPTGTAYYDINFTVASESVETSTVIGIAINNILLSTYNWSAPPSSAWHICGFDTDCNLTLSPLQQVDIWTNASSFSLVAPPLPNQYLKFDIYTALDNDFRTEFLPPAPIATVSEINPSGNNPITLLDGSTSFQPGGNASLVDWTWTIDGGGLTSLGTSLAAATFTPGPNGVLHNGTVTATNATADFSVPSSFVWAAGDSATFALGSENLVASGTGTCALAGSSLTITKSTVTAGTLTLNFTFSTTISAGCTNATLSLASTGVTFLANPGQEIATSTGEEVEISPALPATPTGTPPYLVILQVTNSNGMTGSSSVTYTPPD